MTAKMVPRRAPPGKANRARRSRSRLLRLSLDKRRWRGYDQRVNPPNPIVDALDAAGYRLTGPRRAVADLIAEHDGHFTASELEAAARADGSGISRATLFRALDLLTELGVVERLDLPTGEHAYVPCARAHHHHVICSRCGRTAEVEDCGVAEAVARDRAAGAATGSTRTGSSCSGSAATARPRPPPTPDGRLTTSRRTR